jgi:hypothetical protein
VIRWLKRFTDWQIEHPWRVLVAVFLLTLPAFFAAQKLELHTGFDSLLPENKPSVKEMQRVSGRIAGVSSFIIVTDGSNRAALQRFGDALLPRLRALGPEWVGTAENGVQSERDFLEKRKALFLGVDRIQDIHDLIERRHEFEVYGAIGDDEPEPITRDVIEKKLGIEKKKGDAPAAADPHPGGYYMNAEGTRLVTLLRTPLFVGDLAKTAELKAKVQQAIAETNPASFDPSIKNAFTGDLMTGAEQYGTVKNDMASVGVLGIAMILFVDWLFFLRVRAVAAMAIAIGVGLLWTFAITWLAIGHLNTASGFLISIVFGNGINFGVLLRARFNEARRSGLAIREAVSIAYRDTWRPTLTVAIAAGVGYASLATTSFRGFRDFGLIGGYGMLLCWIATYVVMVPLLVVFEPWGRKSAGKPTLWNRGIPFGAPFSWLTPRAPRVVAVIAAVSAVVAGVATYRYVKHDPLEYELWRLENDPPKVEATTSSKLGDEVGPLVGRTGPDGMAILVDRVDQVKPLVTELARRRDSAPADKKPFGRVVSIFDLVPEGQPEKVALLLDARTRLDRLRELGKISDDDWTEIEKLVPADLAPFGIEDLPEPVTRPFTERDGTRGRIVYIAPTETETVRDVRYLRRWADAYREVKLPNGEIVLGSGRAVIVADMMGAVIDDSPRAILSSFFGTVLVVLIACAAGKLGWRSGALAIASLVTGLAWMGASFAFSDTKLNFLNFIAIPITCGIGADYAINVVTRWRAEGRGSIVLAVRETGGAVVLCSMTTTLGYLALLRSVNAAVRSFGLAAVTGEVACLLAALVALPAVLAWSDRRNGVGK